MKIRTSFVSNSSSSSFIAISGEKFGSSIKRIPFTEKKDVAYGKYVLNTFSGEYSEFDEDELDEMEKNLREGNSFIAGYSYNGELEQVVRIFIDEDGMLAFECLFGEFDPEDYRFDFADSLEEDDED